MKGWILPTLGAVTLWGLWAFIPKITMKYINPKSAMVYEVLGAILIAIVVLYFLNFRPNIHPNGLALAITTGIVGSLGVLCFLTAVSKGPVSLVATLSALYPVISIILATILLKETMTVKQVVGIVFALIAIILITI